MLGPPALRGEPRRRCDALPRADRPPRRPAASRPARRARRSPTSRCSLNQLDEVKTELAVDGIYGPITTQAVKEFQAAHAPLKANGVAGADTQAAVAEALTEEQDPVDIGRKLFNLGAKAFDRHKFGHAYAFFTRAGELTDRPGILSSRAQSLRKLGGRREEAIALYEQYLATGAGTRDADATAALARATARPRRPATRPSTPPTAKGYLQQGRRAVRGARLRPRLRRVHEGRRARRPPRDRVSRARSRCGGSAAAGRRRSRSMSSTSPTGGGTRDADARAALAELRTPQASGDEDVDTATAQGHLQQGRRALRGGRLRPRLRRVHPRERARRPPGHPLLTRPGAAQARRSRGRGDGALPAVHRPRRGHPRSRTPSRCSSCCARTAPRRPSRASNSGAVEPVSVP